MKAPLRYEALTILKTFDKKEFADFGQFLSVTPFLNTIGGKFTFGESTERKKHSTKLAKFFTLLKPTYPDFSGLTNEYLMKKTGAKSISLIKKYFAQLKLFCNHFLVLKEVSIDKYYYDEALLYQYRDRYLHKSFDLKYANVLKNLNRTNSYLLKDFYMKYSIGLINYNRQTPNYQFKTHKDLFKAMNLQIDPSFNLLFFFVFDSIKLIVNLIGHANATNIFLNEIKFYSLFKKCFPDKTLEDIIKKAIQMNSNKITKKVIELYYLNYLFRTTKGKEAGDYFKKYIDILTFITSKLNANEKYDLYHERHFGFWLALEYPEFEKEEFRFYDLYLKNKAYKGSGKDKIQLLEFKNLILRGDNTSRFDWTTRMMKNFLSEVKPEARKSLQHLRNAFLFFLKDKNFKKSLEELREIDRKGHHSMTRDILHLYILIYYELGYYDSALTSIDSLRKYLSNQNIAQRTAEPFKKFITCVKNLITNKINHNDDYGKIHSIINENNLIVSKQWLLEKISEQRSKKSSKPLRITAS